MRIINIRFGTESIKRLYIGTRLVWDRSTYILGLSTSNSHVAVNVTVPIINNMSAVTVSNSYGNGNAEMLEITFAASHSEACTFDNVTTEILQALVMFSTGKSKSEANAYCDNILAIVSQGVIHIQSETIAHENLINVIPVRVSKEHKNNTHSSAGCDLCIVSTGAMTDFSYVTSRADALKLVESKLVAASINYDEAKIDVNSVLQMRVTVCENSFDNNNADTTNVVLANSSTNNINHTWTIGRFFDVLLISSTGTSTSYSHAAMDFNQVFANQGYTSNISNNATTPHVLDATLGHSKKASETNTSHSMVMLYPPIGDGTLLFDVTEEERTKDGNILEIRQVYKIIVNEKDGILEVI